jgi:transposase, IS30 family
MVQQLLDRWWSPEQICHELRRRFPGQPERHLVPETIYQAIYVQGRGGLRRELHRALRTGCAMRRPRRGSTALPTGKIPGMVMISGGCWGGIPQLQMVISRFEGGPPPVFCARILCLE